MDKNARIDELNKFEEVLNVNVCVVSVEHGNKFITTVKHPSR